MSAPSDQFAHVFGDPRMKSPFPPPNDDPFTSQEYARFVESMVPHCHCADRHRPCDSVLAGGLCDNVQDDPEEIPDDDER